MKTTIKFLMKSFILAIIILSVASIDTLAKSNISQDKSYSEITGKLIDSETNKPLVFATISVEGENTATVSNIEGEFILKFENSSKNKNVIISHLGYENLSYPIRNFGENMQVLKLNPTTITLEEITIHANTPDQILKLALEKVPENFSTTPNNMTAFFREFIIKGNRYVSLAEAVLEVDKSDYINDFSSDKVKILKGRKGTDVKRLDTLIFKVQGGPATILLLDVAKYPDILFDAENWENYKFTLESPIKIHDRSNYVVKFEQAYHTDFPMYNGRIFIDTENYAISGLEIELNILDETKAGMMFLRKKPAGSKVLVEKAIYSVTFREQNGKWYFNSAKGFVNFKVNWDKKLFHTKYTTTAEIAITDRTNENMTRIKAKESFKTTDIFEEKIELFSDENFWGSYNTIKPDDPIEKAIERLQKINR